MLQLKAGRRGELDGVVGPRDTPPHPSLPLLPPPLTSCACRRLAFHSCRMMTSHCGSVAGLRRCRGRPAKGGAPGTCLPLCWLPTAQGGTALALSASSSLKQS